MHQPRRNPYRPNYFILDRGGRSADHLHTPMRHLLLVANRLYLLHHRSPPRQPLPPEVQFRLLRPSDKHLRRPSRHQSLLHRRHRHLHRRLCFQSLRSVWPLRHLLSLLPALGDTSSGRRLHLCGPALHRARRCQRLHKVQAALLPNSRQSLRPLLQGLLGLHRSE